MRVTAAKKTAVVIAHGMGEQVPMETLRGFVDAVWVTDSTVHWAAPPDERPEDIWTKPDDITGSLELRRITTRWMRSTDGTATKGPRVDFFEFYWADLAEGTTVHELWDWLRTLLLRRPSQVPNGLLGAWLLLWGAAVLVASLSLLVFWPWKAAWLHLLFAMAAATVGYVMQYVVSPYVGDVARYVRADPRNVAMRRQIRERGLKLLEDIHAAGAYDRVILVAHSLGTIVAYDLISLFWARRECARTIHETEAAFDKLRAVEHAGSALSDADEAEIEQKRIAYRDAQRDLGIELRRDARNGNAAPLPPERQWLISDFVTMGSPLTHAKFLLARDAEDFDSLRSRWLFPTACPQFQKIDTEQRAKIEDRGSVPAQIWGPTKGLFSYYKRDQTWLLHHAAPFAAVRWTNIFDPHRNIYQGDIISGPLAPVFGPAIEDIDLRKLRGPASEFSHTRYWEIPGGNEPGSAAHLKALRKAVNLLDRPESELQPD